MKSNASGQMLGYVLQLQRALVYLLKSGKGSSVCVELIGDVGVLSENGNVSEEDKSSISSNPVTNKSTNLWKTFANWIDAVNGGDIDIKNTRFILYSNQAGAEGIVDWFSNANKADEAKQAIDNAKANLQDLEKKHSAYPYFQKVYENEKLLIKIVSNFEFIVGSKFSSDEVKRELINNHIPEKQTDFVHDEMLGWLTNTIMKKISEKQLPVVTWAMFNKKAMSIFARARSKALIDFTRNTLPTDQEIQDQQNEYPRYLQQLQIISLSEEGQVQAVSDYLRSKINLSRWIEDEIIDENSAIDFEDKLKRFWNSTRNRVAITYPTTEPEDRGKLVYYDCIERNETISNQAPPASTIPGAYNGLADDGELGWHESWEELLSCLNEKGDND